MKKMEIEQELSCQERIEVAQALFGILSQSANIDKTKEQRLTKNSE